MLIKLLFKLNSFDRFISCKIIPKQTSLVIKIMYLLFVHTEIIYGIISHNIDFKVNIFLIDLFHTKSQISKGIASYQLYGTFV